MIMDLFPVDLVSANKVYTYQNCWIVIHKVKQKRWRWTVCYGAGSRAGSTTTKWRAETEAMDMVEEVLQIDDNVFYDPPPL